MFTKRDAFCKKSGPDNCPSKAYWTLLKWLCAITIGVLVFKLFITWRLYEAINHYDANAIRRWLKIIGVLFLVSTVLNFWLNRKKMTTVLIEALVGIVITILFIWYTWTLATACDAVSEDPKAVQAAMDAFDART